MKLSGLKPGDWVHFRPYAKSVPSAFVVMGHPRFKDGDYLMETAAGDRFWAYLDPEAEASPERDGAYRLGSQHVSFLGRTGARHCRDMYVDQSHIPAQ